MCQSSRIYIKSYPSKLSSITYLLSCSKIMSYSHGRIILFGSKFSSPRHWISLNFSNQQNSVDKFSMTGIWLIRTRHKSNLPYALFQLLFLIFYSTWNFFPINFTVHVQLLVKWLFYVWVEMNSHSGVSLWSLGCILL